MLLGRLTDTHGNGTELIRADTHDKSYYKALADRGSIRCPDCEARLVHRSATVDSNGLSEKFGCSAISANGNTEIRVPHFASRAIEDHAPGCLYRDDPHNAEQVVSFKAALAAGQPILINVNFNAGFEGLRNRFNTVANQDANGLWEIGRWQHKFPNAVAVPARDITDVLHYLQIAKDMQRLPQLYFNNQFAVQSCDRFVVVGKAHKNETTKSRRVEAVVGAIYDRARANPRLSSQFWNDTPRLFLFEASEPQITKATMTRASSLWGQKFTIEWPLGSGVHHDIKLGMDFMGTFITNQKALDKGEKLWVVATPKINAYDLKRMRDAAAGREVKQAGKPVFMTLTVTERQAFGLVGSEHKKPLHEAAKLQPRQKDLFDDTSQGRRAVRKSIAAHAKRDSRLRGPRHA